MLVRLTALGFRNLEDLELELDRGFHLVLGDNGAGKTSLLEAVYVALTTKSFRTPRLAECRMHDREAFGLVAEVEAEARTRLAVGWSGGVRSRSVNGAIVPLVDHLAAQPVFVWSSSEGEVLTGAPELRRRFVDRGLIGERPARLDGWARWRRALARKRELLSRRSTRGEIEAWNDLFAPLASSWTEARGDYLERLDRALGDLVDELDLGWPWPRLAYRPSPAEGRDGATAVREALARAREAEVEAERPMVGPHRDRIRFLWGGREIGTVASQGERKAAGILLVLAQARLLDRPERRPMALFDDLDSDLDRGRLARLWPGIASLEQVFVSSSHPEVLPGGAGRRIGVSAGRVVLLAD